MVRRGQLILEDRDRPGVRHTAPGAGRVVAINRGESRALQSVVIELSPDERGGVLAAASSQRFDAWEGLDPSRLTEAGVRDLLIESGMWPAFRGRPFERVPQVDGVPDAIFVSVIDTNPLAPDPERILADRLDDLDLGLTAVGKLTPGPVFLCVNENSEMPADLTAPVRVERFGGPHPSGTVGLQMHRLLPVGLERSAWHIGYQDVASIGRLMRTGVLDVRRVVAVGGPGLERPRIVSTRLGASLPDLAPDENFDKSARWIAGSALSGKACSGPALHYLGRYDVQVTVIPEASDRTFLGWAFPEFRRFTVLRGLPGRLFRAKGPFTTDRHGSPRAVMPLGFYERVFPFDIEPTLLLRALAIGDVERAEELGCLELAEEDLALCTFVDPGKADFGPLLRKVLTALENSS